MWKLVSANLNCTPNQHYVCAGKTVNCFCSAACNETIMWSSPTDNNVTGTQLCNSCGPSTSSAVHVEVIACNSSSCSGTFTSRLSYNVSLRMGSSIQIDCSIVPDPPPPPHRDSTPLPGCSLMKEPSQVEWNFIWRACD